MIVVRVDHIVMRPIKIGLKFGSLFGAFEPSRPIKLRSSMARSVPLRELKRKGWRKNRKKPMRRTNFGRVCFRFWRAVVRIAAFASSGACCCCLVVVSAAACVRVKVVESRRIFFYFILFPWHKCSRKGGEQEEVDVTILPSATDSSAPQQFDRSR